MVKILRTGPLGVNSMVVDLCENKVFIVDPASCEYCGDKTVISDYLKENNDVQSQDEVNQQIEAMGSGSGDAPGKSGGENERDMYFADAGRFIIDKDKASIGMLQRVFKIGFNRAARIMDQLCEYGVVGEEEGTKPRKVLMTEEQFEQLLEEI